MSKKKKERPEALATFAEASRADGKKPEDLGLVADKHTAPIPTDSNLKDEAATKVLQEGATGADKGAEEAVDRLPDRIIESRKDDAPQDARTGQIEKASEQQAFKSYDATKDPRTGRPPLPGDK